MGFACKISIKKYMETLKNIKNNLLNTQVGVASVMFGIAIMICANLLANGIANIKRANNVIAVTGSAEKIVKSDNAKMTFTISKKVKANDLQSGYKSVASDYDFIKKYLKTKGVADENMYTEGSNSTEICKMSNTEYPYTDCTLGISGYDINQSLVISIKDVEKAKEIVMQAPSEVSVIPGITLGKVEYFYDKLKDDRVELMSMATKNAMERAKAVAEAGNSALGAIVEASAGVIQVTQVNSVDVSDYGTYDTSTIEKKVTAVVRVSFEVK